MDPTNRGGYDGGDLFAQVFAQHEAVMLLVDPENGAWIVDANRAAEAFYGYSRDHLLAMTVFDINTLPDDAVQTALMQASLRNVGRFEFPHRRHDGSERIVEVYSSPVRIGRRTLLHSIVRDVTDDHRTRQELRESENRFRSVFRHATDGIALTDESGIVIEWNDAQVRLTGVPEREAIGTPIWDLQLRVAGPVDDPAAMRITLQARFSELLKHGIPESRGARLRVPIRVDGTERIIAHTAFSIATARGHRICSIARDVTESQQLQSRLRSALDQKEALMREIHHRVKNNLMLVASLLRLKEHEAGPTVDLSDVHDQVNAIRVVYEKLSDAETPGIVELQPYLSELVQTVFGRIAGRPVEIRGVIEDVRVDTSQAVPLGLIVNELATNTIKHGMADAETSVFSVDLTCDSASGKKRCRLVVANNGPPIADDVDFEHPSTLGLKLIVALVRQLGGQLEIHRAPSPSFVIRFEAAVAGPGAAEAATSAPSQSLPAERAASGRAGRSSAT